METNGKPEKISDELLAQLKFTMHHLNEAEQNVTAKRGAQAVLQDYIFKSYNCQDGDVLNLNDGTIVRKAIETPDESPA